MSSVRIVAWRLALKLFLGAGSGGGGIDLWLCSVPDVPMFRRAGGSPRFPYNFSMLFPFDIDRKEGSSWLTELPGLIGLVGVGKREIDFRDPPFRFTSTLRDCWADRGDDIACGEKFMTPLWVSDTGVTGVCGLDVESLSRRGGVISCANSSAAAVKLCGGVFRWGATLTALPWDTLAEGRSGLIGVSNWTLSLSCSFSRPKGTRFPPSFSFTFPFSRNSLARAEVLLFGDGGLDSSVWYGEAGMGGR